MPSALPGPFQTGLGDIFLIDFQCYKRYIAKAEILQHLTLNGFQSIEKKIEGGDVLLINLYNFRLDVAALFVILIQKLATCTTLEIHRKLFERAIKHEYEFSATSCRGKSKNEIAQSDSISCRHEGFIFPVTAYLVNTDYDSHFPQSNYEKANSYQSYHNFSSALLV